MISENTMGSTEYVVVQTENGPVVVEIEEGVLDGEEYGLDTI